ncbi:MAG TPA: aminotransferase class I/II-fold pyridoxal phosphate-dependent enzyme [Ignavibacteria bacterium]|jgi:cystathionine beta-lyase/cystathionine gamma-synthase
MKNIETKLIWSGDIRPRVHGAVSLPVFQSSTYEYSEGGSYDDVRYIRLNNTPNHIVLGKRLADIEGAEAGLVTTSGMAAITTTLLTYLKAGDHLLAQNILYGGTYDFITKNLPEYKITYDLIEGSKPDEWKKYLKPSTKVIYVESISNPLMEVPALNEVVKFAKENNLVSFIDNTFATPVNFRPPEIGFDISLHSATKYLNGHNDIVAGAVLAKADMIEKIKHNLNHFGGSLDPHACFLLQRGLKTLALRVRYQNESALKIAGFLETHKSVSKVNYPGLESSPYYKQASRFFEGFGGMISFEVNVPPEKFIKNLEIPAYAPSLGGAESLIILPAKTSHAGLTDEERKKTRINDNLIRLSVGVESTEDIIDDIKQAFENL